MHRVENQNYSYHLPLRAEKEGCCNRFKQVVNDLALKHLPVCDFSKSLKEYISFFISETPGGIDPSPAALGGIPSIPVHVFNAMLLNLESPETILYTRLCFAKKMKERGSPMNKEEFVRDSGFWEKYFLHILEKGALDAGKPMMQKQIERLFFNVEASLKEFPKNQEFKLAMLRAFDKAISTNLSHINLNNFLSAVVGRGCALATQALLKGGADKDLIPRSRNAFTESMRGTGRTLLHVAAERGNADVVIVLLKGGASVDVVTSRGETPLHYAAEQGYVEVIQVLLDFGASKEIQEEWSRTPLHVAAENGHAQAVQTLLDFGANIEATGQSGQTALYMAAMKGQTQVVQVLLSAGANKEEAAGAGINTPLQVAVAGNHIQVVRVLLDFQANRNVIDHRSGRTLLDFANTQEMREWLQ